MSLGFDVAERARKEMQEIGGKCGNNNKIHSLVFRQC